MKLIECLISRPSDPCDMVFLWSGTADGHPNSSNLECTFFSTSDWLLDLIFRFSPSLLLSGRPSLFWVDKTGRFWLSFSPGLSWVLWWWLNKTGESEIWDPEVHKKGRQWRFITWTKECGSLPAVWIDFAQSTEPAEQGLRHHVDARLVATLLGAWHIEKKKPQTQAWGSKKKAIAEGGKNKPLRTKRNYVEMTAKRIVGRKPNKQTVELWQTALIFHFFVFSSSSSFEGGDGEVCKRGMVAILLVHPNWCASSMTKSLKRSMVRLKR